MDVLSTREGLAQLRLARNVSQDAELDLGVVRRKEPVALLGDERAPDLTTELGSARNGLKIRVRGREAAR